MAARPFAFETMTTRRSSFPALRVPCHVPAMFCAYAACPAKNAAMTLQRISDFMSGSLANGC